jgi:hypothetical protein
MKVVDTWLVAGAWLFALGAHAQRREPIVPRDAVAACLGENEPARAAHRVSITLRVRVNDEGGLDLLALSLGGETDLTVATVAECVENVVSGARSTLAPGTERTERWSVRLAADPDRPRPPHGRAGDACASDLPRCMRGLVCCNQCGIPSCAGAAGVCMADCRPVP